MCAKDGIGARAICRSSLVVVEQIILIDENPTVQLLKYFNFK